MAIFAPRAVVLYVDNVEISTDFYRQALAKEPLETFDGFVVFGLTEQFTVGLQARNSIDPAAVGAPGSVELSMSYATRNEVDHLHEAWRRLEFTIVLEPTELEFGYTFVATDPDGHRLRVCATDAAGLS